MGTEIQRRGLAPNDVGGHDRLNVSLVTTRPDIIREIHNAYLAAGADLIETNTFGSTSIVLDEYDQGARAFELNRTAAELAVSVAKDFSKPGYPRFVSGAIGPTTKLPSLGHITFDELLQGYLTQIDGLVTGVVDVLSI